MNEESPAMRAERELRVERLLTEARAAVSKWPPLTREQVARVTEILANSKESA